MKTQLSKNKPSTLPAKQEGKRGVAVVDDQQTFKSVMREVTRARPGQPTKFNDDLWYEILERLSCGESLLEICQETEMPAYSTVNQWRRENSRLHQDVLAARQAGAYAIDDSNDNILRGGVLSTGDKDRDKEIAKNNRWRQGRMNRAFIDTSEVSVVQRRTFILPIEAFPSEDSDGL